MKGRAAAIFLLLAAVHVILWIASVSTWKANIPLLVMAYTLGLRHALDADHIAAIDNTTRKLIQAGGKPVTVGLMFSLGHSTVVVAATIIVAIASASISRHYEDYHQVSCNAGSWISLLVTFLEEALGAVEESSSSL